MLPLYPVHPLLRTTALFLLLPLLSACKKRICPDYWDPPNCEKASVERFYGIYKGISTLNDSQQIITQWNATTGSDISQVSFAPDFILQLNARDPRSFVIKDRSFLGNNKYIRSEGSKGLFLGDSLSMDFWMDEGPTVDAGEQLFHYSFKGRKL